MFRSCFESRFFKFQKIYCSLKKFGKIKDTMKIKILHCVLWRVKKKMVKNT